MLEITGNLLQNKIGYIAGNQSDSVKKIYIVPIHKLEIYCTYLCLNYLNLSMYLNCTVLPPFTYLIETVTYLVSYLDYYVVNYRI